MSKAKVMNARVSINPSYGFKRTVCINIVDKDSGLRICTVDMTPEEFGACITGVSERPAELTTLISLEDFEKIGCKKEIKTVFVEKPKAEKKSQVKKMLVDGGYLVDGWGIMCDGTRFKQNGDKHKVILARYLKEGK